MYGVIRLDKLVALHDELSVVQSFINSQNSPDEFTICKLKKDKKKEIEKNPCYQDLYLVRYGDYYVPYDLYDTLKSVNDESRGDLVYCKDVLYRLLEDSTLSSKEVKYINRTISILLREIDNIGISNIDTLNEIHSINEEYKNRVDE